MSGRFCFAQRTAGTVQIQRLHKSLHMVWEKTWKGEKVKKGEEIKDNESREEERSEGMLKKGSKIKTARK